MKRIDLHFTILLLLMDLALFLKATMCIMTLEKSFQIEKNILQTLMKEYILVLDEVKVKLVLEEKEKPF